MARVHTHEMVRTVLRDDDKFKISSLCCMVFEWLLHAVLMFLGEENAWSIASAKQRETHHTG